MRLHRTLRPRPVIGITAIGLAVAGSGLFGALRSDAAGCGAAPSDFYGAFVAHRAPAHNAPDHADDEPLTATFSEPDHVVTDNHAARNGQVYATQKGDGTFTVGPLAWTERGTRTIGDKSGPYELSFKATNVECAGGTRVSGFTGAFSGPSMATTDTETYTRTS